MLDNSLRTKLSRVAAQFNISDGELLDQLLLQSRLIRYSKDQPIIPAGEHPKGFGFLTEGMVRYYYITQEGKERNKCFFMEDHAVGSLSALITGQESPFTIEAVEASEMIFFPAEIVQPFAQRFVQFQEMLHQITQRMFLRNERREAMLLMLNAEQRYQWLLEQEPELVERVPQYHLASYLAMDAVSLSRIKRKLSR